MLTKIVTSTIIAGVILTGTVEAYDLPKIKVEKKVEEVRQPMFGADWKSTTLFEDKLKILIAEEILPPSSPERISYDKNCIFVAFYKGNAYFLDKYSVKVKTDLDGAQSWTQKIFPIGKDITPKNAQATDQKFYFDGKNFYNSSNKNNPIDAIVDADDKDFLTECFRVGYYFAFGKELEK